MKRGERVRRGEDHRLLIGKGAFLDDLAAEDALHAVVLRSPHAHADIEGIDTAAAAALPGIRLILTGADALRDGISPIPPGPMVTLAGAPLAIAPPPYPILVAPTAPPVCDAVALVRGVSPQ